MNISIILYRRTSYGREIKLTYIFKNLFPQSSLYFDWTPFCVLKNKMADDNTPIEVLQVNYSEFTVCYNSKRSTSNKLFVTAGRYTCLFRKAIFVFLTGLDITMKRLCKQVKEELRIDRSLALLSVSQQPKTNDITRRQHLIGIPNISQHHARSW